VTGLASIESEPVTIVKERRSGRDGAAREPLVRWVYGDQTVWPAALLETFGQLVVDRTVVCEGVGLGDTSGGVVGRDCSLVRPVRVGVRDEDLGRVWISVAKPFSKGVGVAGIDGDVAIAWDVVSFASARWEVDHERDFVALTALVNVVSPSGDQGYADAPLPCKIVDLIDVGPVCLVWLRDVKVHQGQLAETIRIGWSEHGQRSFPGHCSPKHRDSDGENHVEAF
jgi:hypothetical protein